MNVEESEQDLDMIVDHALDLGVNFCDVRMDSWQGFNMVLMQSKTRGISSSLGKGAGIRALVDGAWG
jgi:predicted Zn-dependent protease